MPKNKSKSIVYSDSSADSEAESEATEKQRYESDADSDTSIFGDNEDKLASSTQIEPKKLGKRKDIKLALAEEIRIQRCAKSKWKPGVRRIPWDKISFDGYTSEELKGHLDEIIKKTSNVRTLEEMLNDYMSNHSKLDLASHPEYPQRPISASWKYFADIRDKLKRQMEKESGSTIAYGEIFIAGMEKYKNLSDKKKQPYIQEYQDKLKEYQQKRLEFFQKYPEMKVKTKAQSKKSTSSVSRSTKAKKPSKSEILTPFNHYREQLSKEGNVFGFATAQRMWKELSREEKGKYITEVAHMDTEQQKKITKDELKMMDLFLGVPKPPLSSAYQYFGQEFKKKYTGDSKSFISNCAIEWKKITEKEKSRIQREVDKNMEKYLQDMEGYIKTLPKEQQALMLSKCNVYKHTKLDRKKKLEDKSGGAMPKPIKVKVEKTKENEKPAKLEFVKSQIYTESDDSEEEKPIPSKKATKAPVPSEDDARVSPKKKKKRESDSSDHEVEETPRKKKKIAENGDITSPKKQKVKEPAFPSQSTAHFYMTKYYEGKPSKISKVYKKLDKQTKRKYREEMRKLKSNFLLDVGHYIKTLKPADVATYQAKMKSGRQQQQEELAWHVDQGTDNDSSKASGSSDSEEDSDSS